MTYLLDADWIISFLNGRAEAVELLFQLVGIGRSGIPGGVSGKKHEAIKRAKRPQ